MNRRTFVISGVALTALLTGCGQRQTIEVKDSSMSKIIIRTNDRAKYYLNEGAPLRFADYSMHGAYTNPTAIVIDRNEVGNNDSIFVIPSTSVSTIVFEGDMSLEDVLKEISDNS